MGTLLDEAVRKCFCASLRWVGMIGCKISLEASVEAVVRHLQSVVADSEIDEMHTQFGVLKVDTESGEFALLRGIGTHLPPEGLNCARGEVHSDARDAYSKDSC